MSRLRRSRRNRTEANHPTRRNRLSTSPRVQELVSHQALVLLLEPLIASAGRARQFSAKNKCPNALNKNAFPIVNETLQA